MPSFRALCERGTSCPDHRRTRCLAPRYAVSADATPLDRALPARSLVSAAVWLVSGSSWRAIDQRRPRRWDVIAARSCGAMTKSRCRANSDHARTAWPGAHPSTVRCTLLRKSRDAWGVRLGLHGRRPDGRRDQRSDEAEAKKWAWRRELVGRMTARPIQPLARAYLETPPVHGWSSGLAAGLASSQKS